MNVNVHTPVLFKEVLEYLQPKNGDVVVDCTLGGGGHTMALLEKVYPDGMVIAIDADQKAIDNFSAQLADSKFKNNIILVHNNFRNLSAIIENIKNDVKLQKYVKSNNLSVNGILADFGLSSNQLENEEAGFSFSKNSPLDMRFDRSDSNDLTAAYILNHYREEEIYKIIKEFGEERFASRITRNIIDVRRKNEIKTTFDLLDILRSSIPKKFQFGRTHFATKTFQALRIAVNDELAVISDFLPQALNVLATNGRLAVISFHSLEDRIVKNVFRDNAKEGKVKLLMKKPLIASAEEAIINPRSRSAKFRVVSKID